MNPNKKPACQKQNPDNHLKEKRCGRREFLKGAAKVAALGSAAVVTGCGGGLPIGGETPKLQWNEFFKKHYRLMTPQEKDETVRRLEQLAKLRQHVDVQISSTPPVDDVLFGYAFNVTRCEGYMECVAACVKENNLDRRSNTQYIRIFEMEHGRMTPDSGESKFFHEVPVKDHFYMGVQCFHCQNPPCVKACPTQATWQEPDGIVVVDYDWCIGCRYCIAACPYCGRRFNLGLAVTNMSNIVRWGFYIANFTFLVGVAAAAGMIILPSYMKDCPPGRSGTTP